jgi:uncharacterized protein (TIRG00374 family)
VLLRTASLFLGVAVLAILIWYLGFSQILDLLRRIGWSSIPILLLGVAHHAVRAVALRACVLTPGLVRYGDALAIRLSGEAINSLTFTGPVLAEPARAWLLERRGLTLREGFAVTITETLIYAFVSAAMSLVGLLYLVQRFATGQAVSRIAIGVACGLAAFLVASAVAIRRRIYLIGGAITGLLKIGVLRGRLRPDIVAIHRMEDIILAVLRDRPGRFAVIVLLDAVAQACLVLEVFWLLRALQLDTPPSYPIVIEAATKMGGVASLLVPMQIGTAEGTYALVFTVLGLPAASGVALALVRRTRSLIIAGVGLVALRHLSRES